MNLGKHVQTLETYDKNHNVKKSKLNHQCIHDINQNLDCKGCYEPDMAGHRTIWQILRNSKEFLYS